MRIDWQAIRLMRTADSSSYKVSVIIEKDKHGYYAYSPELEGYQTQCETLEEVLKNIKEAITLYLETMSKKEINNHLSKEIFSTSVVVER
ncbi:MAG: type II toxin-antitoxin system HicB family antitoxin [Planctomycetota bacterium]